MKQSTVASKLDCAATTLARDLCSNFSLYLYPPFEFAAQTKLPILNGYYVQGRSKFNLTGTNPSTKSPTRVRQTT